MTDQIKCVICGKSEYKVLFKENEAQIHQIVKCAKCNLMYANPQKITSELYSNRPESLPPLTEDDPIIQQAYNKLSDYKRISELINKEKPGKGKLLEVGAHTGILLDFLKRQGWDVVGIEPIHRCVAYAKDHLGLNMLPTTIESSTFKKETFDVIVMLHIIEHVANPATVLSTINRILKREGLLIIETPTYDTLMFRILGRRERSLSCDQHIYFFTLETLKRFLEQHGFKVINQEKVGRTLTIDRLLWNIGVISKNNFVKKVLKKLSDLLYLHKVNIYLNMRDMQQVYCVKE